MELGGFVPRRISEILAEQMRIEPVIALHGPRSVGKSTVLRGFAEAVGGSVIDLDDVEVREAVEGNLAATVGVGAPVCIDEYQRVPDVRFPPDRGGLAATRRPGRASRWSARN